MSPKAKEKMLDIKFIRENKQQVADAIKNKGVKGVDLEQLLELDAQRSNLIVRTEEKRNLRNQLSKDIATVQDNDAKTKLISEATAAKEDIQKLEEELANVNTSFEDILMRIPNVHHPEMPIGFGEEDDLILKAWLPESGYVELVDKSYSNTDYLPENTFIYKDHIELGTALDLIDVEQSAKVSGSRFCYLKNQAVLLQDAVSMLLKSHLNSKGYMPLIPPVLVKERALYGTSHFPEGKDQVYKIENFNVEEGNELYLVGSSEPANFAYFMDKTFEEEQLPIKLYAQTSCFRSEVGSWGRDVKGIKRVHQFDKLEMNSVATAETARAVFDEFLSNNEWLLQELKLPYRVVTHCTGDSGYNASHLQYDIEVWRPATSEFMEVMTDTWTTDYQARRLGIRYKKDGKTHYAHTINDTGVAFGRMLVAIIENYQQPDGSIKVPEALQKFLGFDVIPAAK